MCKFVIQKVFASCVSRLGMPFLRLGFRDRTSIIYYSCIGEKRMMWIMTSNCFSDPHLLWTMSRQEMVAYGKQEFRHFPLVTLDHLPDQTDIGDYYRRAARLGKRWELSWKQKNQGWAWREDQGHGQAAALREDCQGLQVLGQLDVPLQEPLPVVWQEGGLCSIHQVDELIDDWDKCNDLS